MAELPVEGIELSGVPVPPPGALRENQRAQSLQLRTTDWTHIAVASVAGSLAAVIGLLSGQVWFAGGVAIAFALVAVVSMVQAARHRRDRRAEEWMMSLAAHDAALRLSEARQRDQLMRRMQAMLDTMTEVHEITGRPAARIEERAPEVDSG